MGNVNQPQDAASLPEQLWYKANSLMSYFNDASQRTDFIVVSPSTWAWTAAIVTYVMANALMKKHGGYENILPGGRDGVFHNIGVFTARHATNLTLATMAMAATYSYHGMRTPDLDGPTKPISVQRSLSGPAPAVPKSLEARQPQAVNPDQNACVIQINPRLKPNC